jgi:hypothetical protein
VIANNLRLCAWLLAALLATPLTARADETQAANQTLAQTLFDEAIKLMDAKRFTEACPKLAESQRLDPAGGTLIDLGFCRLNEGKLASAWEVYNEALSQAIKDNRPDREKAAREQVSALEGKLAKLAIDVSEAARRTSQIEIHLDGTSVRQAAWGVLAPIDRGAHNIVVTAPGKLELRKTVVVETDGAVQHVPIPALEDAPVAPVDHTTERRGFPAQAFIGWVTAGIGVAVLGVGVATGILAVNDNNQSSSLCTFPGGTCSQRGFDLNQQAQTLAWISDFGVGIGVAAVGAGLLLVLTTPKARTRIVPAPSAHGAGALFIGSF